MLQPVAVYLMLWSVWLGWTLLVFRADAGATLDTGPNGIIIGVFYWASVAALLAGMMLGRPGLKGWGLLLAGAANFGRAYFMFRTGGLWYSPTVDSLLNTMLAVWSYRIERTAGEADHAG